MIDCQAIALILLAVAAVGLLCGLCRRDRKP